MAVIAVIPFLQVAWDFIKGFFSRFTLRQYLYALTLLAVAYALYSAYGWIYDRGANSRNAEITTLTQERNALQGQFNQWRADTEAADKQFKADQALLFEELRFKLDLANERADQRKVEYREIVKWITPADDARCSIPVNALLLHNVSAEGTASASGHQLSQSPASIQSAASSFVLSEYFSLTTANNSEAVRRGAVIRQWEEWYDESRDQFTQAQQAAARAIMEPQP